MSSLCIIQVVEVTSKLQFFGSMLPTINKLVLVLQNKLMDNLQLHMMHPLFKLHLPLIEE
jgi:hypothetical protein